MSPRSMVFWRHIVAIAFVLLAQHPRLYDSGMMFLGLWLGTLVIAFGGAGLGTGLGYLFVTRVVKEKVWVTFAVLAWLLAGLQLFVEWVLPNAIQQIVIDTHKHSSSRKGAGEPIPAVSQTSPSVDTETAKTAEGVYSPASSKCNTDQSCGSGLYCISGQCRQRGTALASCTRPIECAEGFECRVGHCEAEYKSMNLAKGVRCATDGQCAPTLFCILEVCSERAKRGQPCTRNTECAGDLRCNSGVCMNAKS